MAFQTSIARRQGAGIIGEFSSVGPRRQESVILKSPDVNSSFNIIGRGCSYVPDTNWEIDGFASVRPGNPTPGSRRFAGYLMQPKEAVLRGTSAGTLQPSMQIKNGSVAPICTEGEIFVNVEVGDAFPVDTTWNVWVRKTTGQLIVYPAGFAVDVVQYDFGYANVVRLQPSIIDTKYAPPDTYLAIIHVNTYAAPSFPA